jgi:DNA polymerase-1
MLWLLRHLNLECRNYEGKESTGAAVLESLSGQHPFVDDLLKVREIEKLLGYYQKWKELVKKDGRIHAQYNADQARIRTGRLSCSNPNLQQVPRGTVREIFVPKDGNVLVVIDFAQIEPRVVAQLSQDPRLIQAFKDEDDFYSVIIKGALDLKETPKEIKEKQPDMRNLGKTVGLSVLYGIGPAKLAQTIRNATGRQDMDFGKAKEIIDNYFSAFPGLNDLREKVAKYIGKKGYVPNIFGRHVYVDLEDIHHKGVNSLVQSSASDLCIASQLILQKKLNDKIKLVHLVHDEVVYEVPEDKAGDFVNTAEQTTTQDVLGLVKVKSRWQVPLRVEAKTGGSWAIK